jgi:hypothetical protein
MPSKKCPRNIVDFKEWNASDHLTQRAPSWLRREGNDKHGRVPSLGYVRIFLADISAMVRSSWVQRLRLAGGEGLDYTSLLNSVIRSQWPRGLRRRSAAERLLESWVWIPPGGHGCLSLVSVVCCQVERGLCDGPIPHPEESYRLWCVSVIKWK